ncbi:MAG: HAD family hydrolase [Sulfitobacter sp.]
MSRIKGLIFDKDGTLFDFAATWETWASTFLLRLTDGDIARAIEVGAAMEFDLLTRKFAPTSIAIAGTAEEIAQTLLPYVDGYTAATLLDVLNAEAEKAPQKEAVPLVPLLDEFKARDLRLGLATNDSEAPALAHLGQAKITGYFDFISGSDSGFGGKPAPGQLLAFAQHIGLEPQDIAMVGDSAHDLVAGRAAGMHAVAVLSGMAGPEDLSPLADVVLPDIGHLPEWLDQMAT